MGVKPNDGSCAAFDRERALEGLGDDLELLSEMAELFLDDVDDLANAIRTAVEAGDAQALRRSAHQLKGASSNFHATATVEVALRLERMGQEGELGGAAEALTSLLRELDGLKPELGKLVEA